MLHIYSYVFNKKNEEEILSKLNKDDYIFIIDNSSSNVILDKYSNKYNMCVVSSKKQLLDKIKNLSNNIIICGYSLNIVDEFTNYISFYFDYKEVKTRLENKMNIFNKSLFSNDDNIIVKDALDKFVTQNCDGKYIRGYLINLGYLYNGDNNSYSDELSISYETFQTSILIHDDIIDKASTRRGKDTIPTLYSKEFKDNDKDLSVANSLAICLADYGFYVSNDLLNKTYGNDKNYTRLLSYYNSIVLNTIKGEIIDVYLPFKNRYLDYESNLDDILEISRLKTSWYTIVGPFCLGLILSGVDNKIIDSFKEALLPLGIAFQIKDDILGVFSDNSVLGKDSNDISEFKQTVLYYYVMKSKYKEELLKYYGKENLSKNDIETVRKIIIDSKAYDESINLMNSLFKEAKEKLSKIKMKKDYRNIINGFVTYLEEREK